MYALNDAINSCVNIYGPVSASVCLSVTGWCPVETAQRIRLVFGMRSSLNLSYTVL